MPSKKALRKYHAEKIKNLPKSWEMIPSSKLKGRMVNGVPKGTISYINAKNYELNLERKNNEIDKKNIMNDAKRDGMPKRR